MKIHEYQARQVFADAGMPVPPGEVATTPDEAHAIAARIGKPVVVKAQVHVGGRGKAGGVKLAKDADAAREAAAAILGMDIKGLEVKKVMVAEAVEIASEAYIGVVADRKSKAPVIIASAAGGVEIEEVARTSPEKIVKATIDPLLRLKPYQARSIAMALYDDPAVVKQTVGIIRQLAGVYWANDCTLCEINPLVVTPSGEVLAIDAKVNFDDNAGYRHPEWEELRDPDAEVKAEIDAKNADLSYVQLDGNIGCCVNGAGLAMATMDLVKHHGGEPANFLDIGGSSSPDKVVAAMEIILRDSNVEAILFNIFGGITRCDDVARGIVAAVETMQPRVPIAVRLTGTNEDEARKILGTTNLATCVTMDEVVRKTLALAGNDGEGAES